MLLFSKSHSLCSAGSIVTAAEGTVDQTDRFFFITSAGRTLALPVHSKQPRQCAAVPVEVLAPQAGARVRQRSFNKAASQDIDGVAEGSRRQQATDARGVAGPQPMAGLVRAHIIPIHLLSSGCVYL